MAKKSAKNFSYTPEIKLPKLKKIKAEWDLKNLFYTSEKDPQIEKDLQKTERAYAAFEKKHRGKDFVSSNSRLLKALTEYVALDSLPTSRPLYYLYYRKELDAADTNAERLLNKIEERLTKSANGLLFFELTVGTLSKQRQKQVLNDVTFKKYHFYLENIFESAQYHLSESEEKILNLKSNTSRGLWVSGTEKIISKRTITYKKKEVPIHGALMQFENLPYKERHVMWGKITEVLESVGEIAENELNALVLDKKTNDELRGYAKPYSATTQGYDSTDKTLEMLVQTVETKGYALSRRFFALKKKILKKDLTYIDRNETIGEDIQISLDTDIDIVRDVFYGCDERYGQIFDSMLTSGQIDVWPKKGKGGGAFCSGSVGLPTMVFLNHNNAVESLRTLAHEMGHAIHAERSKTQPTWYEGHSTLTAETASTFFESLVMEQMMQRVSDKQRLALLNSHIGNKIGTIIMCIARFKFELEMHETIRREGGMSWEDMAAALRRHFAAYCGPAITVSETDGLVFIAKPHYRMNFYQYSYSFGDLGSSIMRKRYREDVSYKREIDTFLCAGDSQSVEHIFKSIGIDMSKESTFLEGLSLLEEEIKEFEKLHKKLSK